MSQGKGSKRPDARRNADVLLVAVDEADLALLPGRSRESFASYWAAVCARAQAAARTGKPVQLRPLVRFDYEAFCARRRLDPSRREALDAYLAGAAPADQLLLYQGEPADVLLRLMRDERDAWAMGLRARSLLSLAVEQYGTAAEEQSRAAASRLLGALIGGARTGDVLVLAAKASGLELGSYALPIRGTGQVGECDQSRMETLLAAALLASARGVAALTSPPVGQAPKRVQVWELSPAGLTPSQHGELILAPNQPAPPGQRVEYVPGFDLSIG